MRSSFSVCRKHDGARGGEYPTGAVHQRQLWVVELAVAGLAAQLPHGLDDEEDAVHAGVGVAEAAAAGVQREVAAGGGPLPRHEVWALAPVRKNPSPSSVTSVVYVKES